MWFSLKKDSEEAQNNPIDNLCDYESIGTCLI